MASGGAFSLILLLGLLTARGRALRISGIYVPPTAISGNDVKFTCNYQTSGNETLYSLKWYRGNDQFYEYIPRNNPPIRVYQFDHISVDRSRSDQFSVTLKGITRKTSGTFRCEVMGDKPLFETDFYNRNMTVVDIPKWGPRITNKPIDSKIGVQDQIHTRCEVGPSDPPVEMSWLINRASPPPPPYARIDTYKNDQRSVSELKVQVTKDSFYKSEMVISCRAKLMGIFDHFDNITYVDENAPKPAGFGSWLSSGSSSEASLLLLGASVASLVTVV